MLLAEIVNTSSRVSETRSRVQKIGHLADCLRRVAASERIFGTAYLSGYLPQGRIGVGTATLRACLPGTAASAPELTLTQVDEVLEHVASTKGPGSTTERRRLLTGLFSRATAWEQDFLLRLLLGELRQGALEGLMADAIAKAATVPIAKVRRALMLSGDPSAVAEAALRDGSAGLSQFTLQVLRPVRPMLARPAENLAEVLQELGSSAGFEFKLDGARVQVHKSEDDVRVFSRQLNDVTTAVPELVETMERVPARSIILDGETLALQPDASPYPFQTTMRRFGRKVDVAEMRQSLPLSAFFFDCIHLDGDDLIDARAEERFAAMTAALGPEQLIPRLVTGNLDEASAFIQEALRQGHEGVMVKALNDPYEAGSRGKSWLKVKQVHTLDLVVLAAEWGHGRRKGWLSNLHLGARSFEDGKFVMLGKTFKGMTDQMLAWQTERLLALEVARDGDAVHVRPELVVEIGFNDIQASPHYPGGLALRFARVKRYRPDKQVKDADTIETVRTLFAQQRGHR